MEKLKDIKGIVEVVDYSLFYLIGIIFCILLVLGLVIYLIKKPKRRKKLTIKEIALKNLQNIDYEDEKNLAYIFTLNIGEFVCEENQKEIETILHKLEDFKYKKHVNKADSQLKKEMKEVIQRLKK